MNIGINLNYWNYYQSDLCFTDLMVASQYFGAPNNWWIPAKEGYCRTGNYTLTSPGIGRITVTDDVSTKTCDFNNDNAQYTLVCTDSYKRWLLRKSNEDSGNPLDPSLYQSELNPANRFYATFSSDIARFNTFRCGRWVVNIDGCTQTNWSDTDPLKWQIACELANATGAIPWFQIPHLATSDYCVQCGALIASYLNAGIVPYLEYSNEVWNWNYPFSVQTGYVYNYALANGFTSANWRGQYAIFANDAFNSFASGFGRSFRRVLSGQHYNVATITTCLDYADAHGITYNDISSGPYCNFTADWTTILDQWNAGDQTAALGTLFANNYTGLTDRLTPACVSWKAVADGRGVPLLGYEWAPNWDFGSDPTKQAIGAAGAADPQMYQFILDQASTLANYYTLGNFNNYCEEWGGGKYWGSKQYLDDTNEQRWQAMLTLTGGNSTLLSGYPNPFAASSKLKGN